MKHFLRKAYRYLTDEDYRFIIRKNRGDFNDMPDEEYLKRVFKLRQGYDLNLDDPETFCEKIQWLKLYDRKDIYMTMVDKYEVKKYVASIIGDEHIIPTIGLWENVDDIDFDSLPERFVLKCTHDSGSTVICKDRAVFDVSQAREKLKAGLKRNYYYKYREWPYKNVKPRIIAEQYMEDHELEELRDYKFFCFNGEARIYKVDFDRFIEHRANYFDLNSNFLKIGETSFPPDESRIVPPPKKLDEMIRFANALSASTIFVRVDFYEVDGRVYFGEITFYPSSGLDSFIYEDNDRLLGSWIRLPDKTTT